MKSTVSLLVDTHVLLQLIAQLRDLGGAQDVSEAITSAIVRRPGDKQFKLACHLRRESEQQEKIPAPSAPPAQADPASVMWAALLSHAAVPAKATIEPPPAPCRDSTPAPGWDLPERRQFRYRLEDAAFD